MSNEIRITKRQAICAQFNLEKYEAESPHARATDWWAKKRCLLIPPRIFYNNTQKRDTIGTTCNAQICVWKCRGYSRLGGVIELPNTNTTFLTQLLATSRFLCKCINWLRINSPNANQKHWCMPRGETLQEEPSASLEN